MKRNLAPTSQGSLEVRVVSVIGAVLHSVLKLVEELSEEVHLRGLEYRSLVLQLPFQVFDLVLVEGSRGAQGANR